LSPDIGRFTKEYILRQAVDEYNNGLATFHWQANQAALLVIDMQNEFVEPGRTMNWIPGAIECVREIKKLLNICRTRHVPVIYTVFSPTHELLDRPYTGSSMPNRHKGHAIESESRREKPMAPLDGIWPDIAPLPGEIVIHKPSYGAFYDTPLQTILRNLLKDTVIVCGTLTNFCCGMTARQAYERGFKVVFCSDGTVTDDAEMHNAELKVLRRGFAHVATVSEIMDRMV